MLNPAFLEYTEASPPSAARSTVVATDLRFHLAEDRIREFLMGENLYGDAALALRELYQNALDACRLARARRQLLGRAHPEFSSRRPEIEVEQGVDTEGRHYIDCIDRGPVWVSTS